MNITQQAPAVSRGSSAKMLQAMVGIGILCALLIVLTYEGTLPRIKANRAAALERAIFRVIPEITHKQTFRLDEKQQFVPVDNTDEEAQYVHAGYDEKGNLKGIAIEASGMGFADVLRILYGYDPGKQQVVGFYVLESKETPGLGDKIEKDADFLANFQALDVSLNEDENALLHHVIPVKHGEKEHPWEIDGITGATISSRAIGNILGTSTERIIPLIHQQMAVFQEGYEQENNAQ